MKFLRAMNSESVHLIATDPPFNKGRDFHATPDSLASGASFQDRWSWDDDVHDEWVDRITDDFPKVMNVIEGSRNSYGDDMGAFLCFMAVRLVEMHRVLRGDGSIFLHCDPTASHNLKELMDAVFGRKQFRNEIVWCYTGPGSPRMRQFNRKHDIIFWYSKGEKWTFNRDEVRIPHKDPNQRPRKAFDTGGAFEQEAIEALRERGKVPETWWAQEPGNGLCIVARRKSENTGYPTQKPLALYERIIKASSSKGDIVLDPFAGCATTCIAAEKLGRQWVGIDIWNEVMNVVLDRLEKEGLKAPKHSRRKTALKQGFLFADDLYFTSELPERTDDGEEAIPFLKTKLRVDEPKGRTMSRAEMVEYLLDQNGSICQGCNRSFDDPRYLELDHNTPRSDGGLNHISNRILLCGPCNRLKSNTFTLSGLQSENRKRGYMAK